jgi:HEAT repeat protein
MALFKRRRKAPGAAAVDGGQAGPPDQLTAAQALEALRQAGEVWQQLKAVQAVGEFGDETAVAPLIELMVRPRVYKNVLARAAIALEVLDGKGYSVAPESLFAAVGRLVPRQWRDNDRYENQRVDDIVFEKITNILRVRVDRRHIPVLLQFMHLTSKDYLKLAGFESSADIDINVHLAVFDHVRHLNALGRNVLPYLDDPAAADALAEEVRARPNDSDTRLALGKAVHPHAVDVLLDLFADPPKGTGDAAEIRRARGDFARALGRHRDPRAVEPLLTWLDSEDGLGPEGPAAGLVPIGGSVVITAMVARLGAPNVRVASTAAYILGEIGNSRAVDELLQFLDTSRWTGPAADAALRALGQIGDRRVVPVLCAKLSPVTEANAGLMKEIAEALQHIGDPAALPALQRIDPGPITVYKSDSGMLDDDTYWYKWRRNFIHDAVAALQNAQGPGRSNSA